MRRLLLVLFVAAGVVVLTPATTLACTCKAEPPETLLRRATSVGTGTVEWIARSPNQTAQLVHFDRVFKGSLGEREKVYTVERPACSNAPLSVGERYVFFVNGEHLGRIRIPLCREPLPATASVVAELERARGPGTEPVVTSTVIDQDEPAQAAWWWTWAVGLTAVAIVAVLVWLGRRRLRRTPGELDARTPHR